MGESSVLFKVLCVGGGGFIGSVARYGFVLLTQKSFPGVIPTGTFGVNAIGCLLAGAAFQWMNQNGQNSEGFRLFFSVGLLGGFTTFSAFAVDTLMMLQSRATTLALLNVIANVIVSLAASLLGVILVRAIR